MLSRRRLLAGLAAAAAARHPLVAAAAAGAAAPEQVSAREPEVGTPLSRWTPGTLDIHHLGYGRGDATFIVLPDGSSLLIDAGAVLGDDAALVDAARGTGNDPGVWIAQYIRRHIEATGKTALDAAIVTHLHIDHIGELRRSPYPLGPAASHTATGISSVASHIDIGTIYDPDWPEYGYPAFEGRDSIENYIAFVRDRAARGGRVARLDVGKTIDVGDQRNWSLRTVACRGRVWTGKAEDVREVFPGRHALDRSDWPNENAMSAAFLLSYGPFRYFLGGDLTDWQDAGTRPWMNALTPAAQAAGPVHVSTVPHHGMFDAASTETVRALAARDWVISAWHASHPSLSTLERLFSTRIYSGPRDIYATALHPAAQVSMRRLTDRFAGTVGHVVCRVAPGGAHYRIIVTERDDAGDRIVSVSDPRPTLGLGARAVP